MNMTLHVRIGYIVVDMATEWDMVFASLHAARQVGLIFSSTRESICYHKDCVAQNT